MTLLHKMRRDALILSRNAWGKKKKKHGEMFVDVGVQNHGIYLGVWYGSWTWYFNMSCHRHIWTISQKMKFLCFYCWMISQIMGVSSSFLNTSSIPWEKRGSPYLDMTAAAARAALLVLVVCVVLLRVHTKLWLPVLGTFNVQTDVDACDWTWWLH